MKNTAMLITGLVLGALVGVIAMLALRQPTPYHKAHMTMLGKQFSVFQDMNQKDQCNSDEIARRLDLMHALAGETNNAFLPTDDDARFTELSDQLLDAVSKARSEPVASCQALGAVMGSIGKTCKGCHDVFK